MENMVSCIHTYMTVIGMISISEDGEGNITGVYLPNYNLPVMEDQSTEALDEAAAQIEEYFSGERKGFDLPIVYNGTEFQELVWKELLSIPYGRTMTYSEVAASIGRENSYRAVGGACGANPLPIIIPCHRVISAGKTTVGYAGGSILKRRLLDLESGE
ncbi:MAG: methylated-DNA--[protein]-cysteine S-methyltransferase [Euryarchaeota archaeon]|jgi:methylated-DNA-[protein]-cysteine S-methyltransferase|nr:methylated-DNA--[protein]-cysteine S-methyltransferase [Euryarchaeota archaeon]